MNNIKGEVFIMVNAKDVLYKMRVCELNNIIKLFHIKVGCRKKESMVEIIFDYMRNNMSHVLHEIVIYDELNLLREICSNNFEYSYDEGNSNIKYAESLEKVGILYVDKEKNIVSIPGEYKHLIKSCLNDRCLYELSKNRAELIRGTLELLEVYGVFHLDLLEDYLMERIGVDYKAHRAIEFIRRYNIRNNFFYEDKESYFYNLKIEDRKSMKMRLLSLDLNYKYYNEEEMAEILNRECAYEKDVKIILNRVFKNFKSSNEIIKVIRVMIIEGKSTEEIGSYIKEKAKRLGEFGYKSILKSVESMKNHYIIWGHKGYYLEELDEEMMI